MEYPEHTYIRRRGRVTRGQARALRESLDHYRIELTELAQWQSETAARKGIEIGFGMGENLLGWAVEAESWQLLGIELYQPGIGSLVAALQAQQIHNVHIVEHPAQTVFDHLQPASVDEIRIFFPDPWPKKKHWRRRLIQPDFVRQISRVLVAGGIVHLATDWAPYASWMRECFAVDNDLNSTLDQVRAAGDSLAAERQTTKFEQRGQRLGHDICDLIYERR
ncbi:MAG: tRNA (guanosine(46)-N7)-methyltransferase TrmB [Pseudomonadota bacterium]